MQALQHSLPTSPQSPGFSPGHAPAASNPFTKRLNEIRETVTKNHRVKYTAVRLRNCMRRNGLLRLHCVLGVVLGLVLGLLYYGLPMSREGIEKRESLFRIIVGVVM